MGSKASKTAIETEPTDNANPVNEASKNIEWEEPPDGGWRAWLVVFGSFCGLAGRYVLARCYVRPYKTCLSTMTMNSSGVAAIWSVFLSYYNSHVYPNSMTELSWIGSLAVCFGHATGPFYAWTSSKLDDRYAIVIGGLVIAVSMMLASITHEIWQLWITQGLLSGLGMSMVHYPCINQTMTWFAKRRGLAVGCCMSGIGFSSIAYSNIATACFQTLGYRWALRILGFIELVLCGIAAALCTKLNPQSKAVPFLDFSVFKNKKYVILVPVHFIGAFAFYIPEGFIAPYAKSIGIDPWNIANITGSMVIFASVGSIILNFVADHLGRFNMAVFSGLLCVIIQLSVWFTATTAASFWAFAILYGMVIGSFGTLIIAVIVDCVGVERSEIGVGWILFTGSFGGLLGQPFASMIINRTNVPNYQTAIVFAASICFFVTCLMMVLRIMVGGWSILKKV